MFFVAKPNKSIGFGAMDVTKPYKFIGFGAMDVTKPVGFFCILCLLFSVRPLGCSFGVPGPPAPAISYRFRGSGGSGPEVNKHICF